MIDGLAALLREDYFLVAASELLAFDYRTWGWILISVGLVQFIVALGLFGGRTWARILGVFLAMLAALGQLVFLPAYPIWSVVVIGICVLVIAGLTAASPRPPAAPPPTAAPRPPAAA